MNKKVKSSGLFLILISFVLSALFCFIIWAICGIYPGSSRTLINSDMMWQYVSFFNSLKSIVSGKNSIFYNWSLFLGGNYLGLYAYYLASPFSWITLLWKTEDMPTAVYFLCLLKIALCGGSFSAFLIFRPKNKLCTLSNVNLNYVYDETVYNIRLIPYFKYYISVIFFSLCYALMGYNMMYVICPMWLDSVIILPIVILGLEQLISENKCLLYFVSFALSFFLNFYTAYMIAIFTVLYFLYYYFYSKEYFKISEFFIILGKYIFNSILAVGCSMVLVLPTVYSLFQGKTGSDSNYFDGLFTHNLFSILARFFDTSYDTIRSLGLPCVFCGSACVLFAVFFIVKGINNKGRVAAICVMFVLILSMWIVPLNRLWHCLKDPNWFPFRYSFVISFFILYLGYEGFNYLQHLILKSNFKKYNNIFISVVLLFTFIELFFCSSNCRNGQNIENAKISNEGWINFCEVENKYLNYVSNIENCDIADFDFRLVSNDYMTSNDPMLFGYMGISSFSSLFNEAELNFMKEAGYLRYDNQLYSFGGTPISDSILGIKYRIVYGDLDSSYKLIDSNIYGNLYYNNNALSIGYLVKNIDTDLFYNGNPFIFQNNLLNCLSDSNEIYFSEVDYFSEDISYEQLKSKILNENDAKKVTVLNGNSEAINKEISFNVDEPGYYYLYVDFAHYDNEEEKLVYCDCKEFFLNGELLDEIDFAGYSKILNLGYYDDYDLIELLITNCTSEDNIYICRLDVELTNEAFDILNAEPSLENIIIKNGNLTADINTDTDGVLFLSIPYDEGWEIYIDGKKTDYKKVMEAFIGIDLVAGEHSIKMIYISPKFFEGLFLSLVFLIIKIIGEVFLRKKKSIN